MEGGNSITWKGKLSGTELAVLPFTGVPKKAKASTRSRCARPTPTAASSSGPATRAPTRRPRTSRRRLEASSSGGGSDSSKTIAIIALVVGALGLARRRRRARRGEAHGMRIGGRAGALLVALAVALALPAAAWGHASLLATQPQASGVLAQPPTQVRLTYSERIEPRFAVISVTDAHGQPGDGGQPGARARRRERDLRPAAHAASGLVPRLVARDLGRRAPGARRVHVRGRAEPRARRRSS